MKSSKSLRSLLDLKAVPREGWRRFAIPQASVESVADHSYGVALLVLLLCPPELNRARAVEMALLHDLAEVVTGDILPSAEVAAARKAADELEALRSLSAPLGWQERACELLAEYHAQSSPEARFVKAVDKLDMALQSLSYEEAFEVNLQEFRDSAHPLLVESGLIEWLRSD